MRKLLLVCIAVLIAIVMTSAPTRAQTYTSVFDVVSSRKELTTMKAALKAIGFDTFVTNHYPFTVFAPTDDAFATYEQVNRLTADQLLADKQTLLSILTYHIVPGWLGSGALGNLLTTDTTFKLATLHGSELVTISAKNRVGMVNDAALVIGDLDATVGTVHIIDKVLLPHMPPTALKPDTATLGLLEVAKGQPNLKTFVTVATAFSSDINTGLNTVTVFAPTDEAFATTLKALNLTQDQLLADSKNLSHIIRNHFISWTYSAATLLKMDGAYIGTSVTDTVIKVMVKDGKVMLNGTATVITPDLPVAGQVVVHVIDGVLIPMLPTGAAASPAVSATAAN